MFEELKYVGCFTGCFRPLYKAYRWTIKKIDNLFASL